MLIEDYIAKRLRGEGIRKFFGIPGGPSIPYMEAFRRTGIDFILTTHESSAAIMADVTARLTGITGVCHGTFGPGAVNLASGVGGALLDRSPLLALTTEMPEAWLGRTAQMNIDHQALFRPLTKATYRLSAANAEEIISRSLRQANEEYPGPVHIGLPSDLAGSEITLKSGRKSAPKKHVISEKECARAWKLIASARRPLIAAGLTAVRTGSGRALLKFLEQHEVPVVVTPMAKGVIDCYHPCFAGVLFHSLSDRLDTLINASDLVIGLGYDPVEYNYESWLPTVPLVHFDTRPSDLGINGAIEIVSDPEEWFRMLSSLKSSPEMISHAARARKAILDVIRREVSGLNPVSVLTLLREMLPPETTVTADVGSHLHLIGQMWDVQKGRLIMTNGWSSMGFGLPAAVAAAITGTGETVVCLTGDGGLMMHAGEIITARRLGVKVIVVVFSDGELNLIKIKQSWKKADAYGIQLCSGSLFGTDIFLGTKVIRVTDAAGLRFAMDMALCSETSVIIEAKIDPTLYGDLIVRS
jgi:acetolactate synthase-1/2/3 large subunit